MDKDLRFISAETILIICDECRKQLVNDLEQILQATLWLDQMEAGSEAAQCLLKGLVIEKYLMELGNVFVIASAKLISRLTSMNDIHHSLKLLFERQIQSLTQVCLKKKNISEKFQFYCND